MDLRENRAAAFRRLRPDLLHTGGLLLCALLTTGQSASPDRTACLAFQHLNDQIRDQTVGHADARRQLTALLPRLDAYYQAAGGQAYAPADWVFPLKGYTATVVGGKRGNGYQPKGYAYFKGNRHAGHPAHDLFIYDKNQDGLDDRTRQPVEVRALTGGVVVALSTSWTPGSSLRGGNYVWVYAPYARSLFYYAHNATVRVSVGDIVRPGDVLATVGRTGLNAYQQRSPTHLHFMQLTLSPQQTPVPTDCYQALVKARTQP